MKFLVVCIFLGLSLSSMSMEDNNGENLSRTELEKRIEAYNGAIKFFT